MKRKIIGAAAAYMSGLFFASFFTDLSGIIAAAAVGLAFAAVCIKRGFSRADLAMMSICFMTAVGANTAYTRLAYDPVVRYDSTSGSFTGKVTDFDVYDGDFAVYTLRGRINGDTPAKIQLLTTELDASYGDIVTVEDGEFSVPVNTYVFPAADYCRSNHIYLTAANGDVSVEKTNSGRLKALLADIRNSTERRFIEELGEETGGFLSAMTFGEKEYLDSSLKISLYRSGIGHIMAVSGLHVSIAAAVVMAALRRLRVNRYLSFGAVNLLMLAVIGLANCPISAIRAALMLDIMYSARLFRQQNDSLNSLSAAALLICLADPYAVWSSGFLLSLSGTFGIAVLGPYIGKRFRTEKSIMYPVITAICTSISVFPASAFFFDEVSVISPLTNLILVPFCSFAMLIGLADMATFGGLHLLPAAYPAIKIVTAVSDAAASTGFAHISRSGDIVPFILLIAGVIAVLVHLFTGSRKKTALTIAAAYLITGAAYAVLGTVRSRECIVAVLGRSVDAAVVVTYRGRTDIFDLTGSPVTDEYVRKYLAANGILPDTLTLTANSAPRYSAYTQELDMYAPKKIIMADDSSDMSFSGECGISYSDGVLTVSYGDSTVSIQPYGSEVLDGYAVFYGKGGDEPTMNNFELILSGDGGYKIRRL